LNLNLNLNKFKVQVCTKMCLVQSIFFKRRRTSFEKNMKKTKRFQAFRNGDLRGEERGVTGFKVKKTRS